MPAKEQTILFHEDPSKETWLTPKIKIKRNLRERASTKNFSLGYKTDSYGTWEAGPLKSNTGTKAIGISVKKEF